MLNSSRTLGEFSNDIPFGKREGASPPQTQRIERDPESCAAAIHAAAMRHEGAHTAVHAFYHVVRKCTAAGTVLPCMHSDPSTRGMGQNYAKLWRDTKAAHSARHVGTAGRQRVRGVTKKRGGARTETTSTQRKYAIATSWALEERRPAVVI